MLNRIALILTTVLFLGCHNVAPLGRYALAMKALSEAVSETARFYALDEAAKESLEVNKIEDARRFAYELLALAPHFQANWNYGNAIHDGNMVLGRIAVAEGKIDDARRYLQASGGTKGSPQLNSFGPNMSLAKDMLGKGQNAAVLSYLQQCRKFWKMEGGRIDQWTQDIQAGRVPDFGANLIY